MLALYSGVSTLSDMPLLFFFNDTATTEIYTLSLHDALPISGDVGAVAPVVDPAPQREADLHAPHGGIAELQAARRARERSEEHTSELQSRQYLVCRLLLEKKKKTLSLSFSQYFYYYTYIS